MQLYSFLEFSPVVVPATVSVFSHLWIYELHTSIVCTSQSESVPSCVYTEQKKKRENKEF